MGLLDWFRDTLRPAVFHGRHVRPPFFEGWYFKLVDRDNRDAMIAIPGVYLTAEPGGSHAFVQVMDGRSGRSDYYPYPLAEFSALPGEFNLKVGPNEFSAGRVRLDLAGGALPVRGEVQLVGWQPWPVSLLSPGIMGWYAWVPAMECYHGVLSLDHGLRGEMEIDGRLVDFDGGRGYCEKDWGKAFPRAWVWMQSNHFSHPGVSLTASIAVIPWMGTAFNGFITGLLLDGRLYRFATYTGARVEQLQTGPDSIHWVLADRRYRLEITARRAQGGNLQAPTRAAMDRRIIETLNARIEVRLFARSPQGDRLLFEDEGLTAGLEAVGDLQLLGARPVE